MNWDEKICHAAQFVDHDPDVIHDAEYADGYVDGATAGAKWQRDQLRTDEAVERVARALAGLEPGEEWPSNEAIGGSLTGTRDDEYQDGMRDQAQEAITALLGEEL